MSPINAKMNPLLKAALLGTAQRGAPPLETSGAVDSLLAQRPEDSPEKQILLKAGAEFLRELAGRQPEPVPELEAAPPDDGIPPSLLLEQLLSTVLSPDSIPLLPEFAKLLHQFQIHLPHGLLPSILELQDRSRREVLRPLLGHRARWLARFNPSWGWAIEKEDSEKQLKGLKTRFDDGTGVERVAAFREIRRLHPQLGRDLLQEDLHLEKGDQKRKLVELLAIGLHPDDEPLLESLRSDRSGKIRELAASFLNLLPDSQLTRRMESRGAECLKLMKTDSGWVFQCDLPDPIPDDWGKDGIIEAAPPSVGQTSWLLRSLIARIPPEFWVTRFHRSPSELVSLAVGHDLFAAMFTGWVDAIARFAPRVPACADWIAPLWNVIVHRRWGRGEDLSQLLEAASKLIVNMPEDRCDAALTQLLEQAGDITDFPIEEWLQQAPRPWSESLSRAYLTTARKLLISRSDSRAVRWAQTFFPAALGLSPALFSQALEPWSLNSDRSWHRKTVPMESILQRFGEVIRFRARFRDEVVRLAKDDLAPENSNS